MVLSEVVRVGVAGGPGHTANGSNWRRQTEVYDNTNTYANKHSKWLRKNGPGMAGRWGMPEVELEMAHVGLLRDFQQSNLFVCTVQVGTCGSQRLKQMICALFPAPSPTTAPPDF